MSEKRFERWNDHSCKVKDNQEDTFLNWGDVVDLLNEQQDTIGEQKIAIDELITDYKKLEKENEKLIQKKCLPCELVNLQTREIDKLKKRIESCDKNLIFIYLMNLNGKKNMVLRMSDYELINGDCIKEMQKLIDDGVKVDLIVTDPPYLMNYSTNRRKNKEHDFCKPILNDDNFELIKDIMPLLFELLNDGGAVYMFC